MTAPVLADRLVMGPSSEALNTTRGVRRGQWDRRATTGVLSTCALASRVRRVG